MARIILTCSDTVLGSYSIEPNRDLTIGRHPGNRVVIDHLSVSGNHARIRQDGDKLMVVDSGSTNGTYVNNERVSECRLAHQDWVAVGNHVLIVDLYDTLSLEGTAQMLKAQGAADVEQAEQTIIVDMASGAAGAAVIDSITLLEGGSGDYELGKKVVAIGRGRGADIPITGLYSLLAGSPAATIKRVSGGYELAYVGGRLKPKINGLALEGATRLKHGDIIDIGSLKMKMNLTG